METVDASAFTLLKVEDIAARIRGAIAIGPFGSRMKADVYVDQGIPVIRGNNLSPSRHLVGDYVHVSTETAAELMNCTVRPGDLVFPHRGNIGTVGIIPETMGLGMLSTSMMKLTVNAEIVDPLYVFYFFTSATGRHELLKNASQVGTPGIATPLTSLKGIRLPVPSLEKQKQVAHMLASLDDKIELNRRTNETLEAMARAIFKSWFVDFDPVRAKAEGHPPYGLDPATAALFPDRFSEDGVPAGWSIESIGKVVTAVGGSTPSTTRAEFWKPEENAWATPKDLAPLSSPILLRTERSISALGIKQISSGLLPRGTVLMSSRAPIGYLALAAAPVAINQGFVAMVCDKGVPNTYVLNWARENMDLIVSRANGSTFLEISKSNFRPLPVLVPTPEILAAFDSRVRPLFERIEANERETAHIARLRDDLLPRLLSGELSSPEVALA